LPPIAITKSEEAFLKTLDPDHAAKVLLNTAAVYSFLVREAKRLMPTYCRRPKMDAVLDEIEIELGVCTENLNPDVVAMKSAKDRI
jgi:hypothetical protein